MKEEVSPQKATSPFNKLAGLIRERWPEYVIEILVIILSISASFALDEWKDERHKRELEQLYLRELARDVESDTAQLHEVIGETRQIVTKASQLSNMSQQAQLLADSQLIGGIRFILKRPRFVAQDATFSDLKSTGNLQSITNFALKNDLFNYYKQYESTVLIEAAELESTNAFIGPYLLKKIPFGRGNGDGQRLVLSKLLNEVEFQNCMLARRSTRDELLQEYRQSLTLGEHILASIRSQVK